MEDNSNLKGNDVAKTVEKQAWSDQRFQDILKLKTLLRPYLYAMAIIGCYKFDEIYDKSSKKVSTKSVLATIYRAVILVLLCLYTARSGAAFYFLPQNIVMINGLVFTWLILMTITYFVFLKATSTKYGHLKDAFLLWDEDIVPKYLELDIAFPTEKIKKRIVKVLVIAGLAVIGNVAGMGMQMYMTTPVLLTSPFVGSPAMITVALALSFVASGLLYVPVGYVYTINSVLYEAFEAFNKHNRKYCAKHGYKISDDFQRIRLLHCDLCKLVEELDDDLGWYYASIFTISIGLMVFNLYQIVKTPLTMFEQVLFAAWLVSETGVNMIRAFSAAYVHQVAHAPLNSIYYINVSGITVEKSTQLNLFLSKLTGTQVGFTCCGFFVITKEFILTIAGVFLTYFAVLYTL